MITAPMKANHQRVDPHRALQPHRHADLQLILLAQLQRR